jgi:hypothetical protein
MAVGNFWIYQQYSIDLNGNSSQTNLFDSTVISKDTLINSRLYFKFDNYEYLSNSVHNNKYLIASYFYRDSSKNLINPKGEIFFSENNFTDTLYKKTEIMQGDTIYWMTCKMEETDSYENSIGFFTNLLNYRSTIICNQKFTDIQNPRYNNQYYAKDFGKVLYTLFYVTSGGAFERRLVKYKIII